jgi:hypothetical protein
MTRFGPTAFRIADHSFNQIGEFLPGNINRKTDQDQAA